jgi:D-alanine-D-alanine ligase
MSQKLRVGLIYGGKSGEHEVSLQTAKAVISAFDFEKYELIPFYITKLGEWRFGEALKGPVEDIRQLTMEDRPGTGADWLTLMQRTMSAGAALPAAPTEEGACSVEAAPSKGAAAPAENGSAAAASARAGKGQLNGPGIDIMFPLLHGTNGEDGTIQGLFEIANLPYVGAGVLASAVGMDKVTMKKVFADAGLPQAIYRHFTRARWERDQDYYLMEIEIAIGYPCFVKPANLGSSVGVSKASNRKELIAAVEEAFRYDRKVVVEEFVNAREIEVAVLGNDDPKASVPGEIISSNEFYDYRAKYIDGKSTMVIPADLPPETAERIREMAVRAFLAIDASGLSRVDFFLRREDGAILINEINTMPGFTPFSMYPLLWKESGLSYRELLDELIRLGLERYNEKQRLQYGFEAGK